jgi:adenylate cyclase
LRDQPAGVRLDPELAEKIDPEEIRAALSKVLASPEFAASPQMCAFLTYVVKAHLAGEDHLLKGQNIGTAVLGRPVGFDSQRDPIVRVEANRLRRTLNTYYQSNGLDDAVRIVVERGSYVPRFERATAVGAAADEVGLPETGTEGSSGPLPDLDAPRRRNRLVPVAFLGVAAAVVLGLASVFVTTLQRPEEPAPLEPPQQVAATASVTAPDLPSVEVMPFVIHGPDEVAKRGRELVSTMTVALARFPELRVIAQGNEPPDFRVDGEITRDGAKTNVSMRLSAADTAEVIWSADVLMRPEERSTSAGIDRLVEIATTAIAPQFGAVANHIASRQPVASPGAPIDDYDCLIKAQLQHHRFSDSEWKRLDACLRSIVERYPRFATAIASRALLLHEQFRLDPREADADAALAEADELARRALQLEPANVRAMTATVVVALGKNDLELARNMGLRAVSANPLDPLARSQYILALLVSGYFDQALAQSSRTRQIDPAHASVYDALDYLAHFGMGTETNPLNDAVTADTPLLPFGLIARILAHDRAGEREARDRAIGELYEVMPLFASDMDKALQRQFSDSIFTEHVSQALRQAGAGTVVR